jgi:hypothetical protein
MTTAIGNPAGTTALVTTCRREDNIKDYFLGNKAQGVDGFLQLRPVAGSWEHPGLISRSVERQ